MRDGTFRTPRRSALGFTLMELMIALALIGMALTIAFAALRFATRSWERTDALGGELDQLRIACDIVRRQLAQVQPVKPDEMSRDLLFSGRPGSLEFVAPAPVQDGRLAALYRYRLRFASQGEGMELLLDYRPYLPGEGQGWDSETRTSVMVSGLAAGRFAYFPQTPQEKDEWQPLWDKPQQLPRMVRMELQLQRQSAPWPALVALLPVTGSVQ